jgi:uncharacterized protein YodC (DUF2158 family)
MTTTFKTGDTVALKSGGPAMTIEDIGGAFINCIWIDDAGEHHDQLIDPACLTPVIRKSVLIDGGFYRAIWVFAETGLPIVDHFATLEPSGSVR